MRVPVISEALAFIVHGRRSLALVHAHVNIWYVVNGASFANYRLYSRDVLRSMVVHLRLHCLLINQVSPRLRHQGKWQTRYVRWIPSLSFLFTVVVRDHVSPFEEPLTSRIGWCEGAGSKLGNWSALCVEKRIAKHQFFTLQVLILFGNLVPLWSLRAKSLSFEPIFVLR